MLFALLLACSPPFDQTRKDLRDFRLVALSAEGASLRALVWSGEGAFHATAPTVTWSMEGVAITEAPTAPFTVTARVESADGLVEEGELVVQADAENPVVTDGTRAVTDTGASLALTVEGDAATRWKASSGTFVETDANAADWTAGDEPLAAIVGLTLDGRGGVSWSWLDVATDAGPYFAADGRLLPIEAPTEETAIVATLTAADNLAGVVLTDVVPASSVDAVEFVCGLDPFDAGALADGRCGLDEALGARVRLEGAMWP